MKLEEVRTLLHTSPFVPFTLHLPDGRKLHVEHPDYVATAHESDTIIVYDKDDSFSVLDLTLVSDAKVGAIS